MTIGATEDVLLVTREGPVATVTLNRPHRRNAVTQKLLDELARFFAACRRDPECKAIILRGSGDHSCVGLALAQQSPMVEISYELEERAQLRLAASGALDQSLADFNARKKRS